MSGRLLSPAACRRKFCIFGDEPEVEVPRRRGRSRAPVGLGVAAGPVEVVVAPALHRPGEEGLRVCRADLALGVAHGVLQGIQLRP